MYHPPSPPLKRPTLKLPIPPRLTAVLSAEHAVVDIDEDMKGIEEESESSSEAEGSVVRTRTVSPAAVVEAIDSNCHLDRLGRSGAPDSDAVVAGYHRRSQLKSRQASPSSVTCTASPTIPVVYQLTGEWQWGSILTKPPKSERVT